MLCLVWQNNIGLIFALRCMGHHTISKGGVLKPLKEKCGKKHMALKCLEKAKSLMIFQMEEKMQRYWSVKPVVPAAAVQKREAALLTGNVSLRNAIRKAGQRLRN